MDLLVDSVRTATTRSDLALADGETYLGGGTWLYSQPRPGLHGLVDLTGMGWPAVEPMPDGGLRIAATCTLAELVRARDERPATDLFAHCCHALLASFKIWNVATVGGNICAAFPAGSMISLATALDADALVWGPDGAERRLAVADLVLGPGIVDLRSGEVLRGIEIPGAALAARVAFRKIALAPLGRSAAVVIGRLDPDRTVTFSVTAATPRPVVLTFDRIPGAGRLVSRLGHIADWYEDLHGAADWRAHVTGVLAEEVRGELAGAIPAAAPPAWPRAAARP